MYGLGLYYHNGDLQSQKEETSSIPGCVLYTKPQAPDISLTPNPRIYNNLKAECFKMLENQLAGDAKLNLFLSIHESNENEHFIALHQIVAMDFDQLYLFDDE